MFLSSVLFAFVVVFQPIPVIVCEDSDSQEEDSKREVICEGLELNVTSCSNPYCCSIAVAREYSRMKKEFDEMKKEYTKVEKENNEYYRQIEELKATQHYELPVGTIITHSSSTVPDGWLLCDGRSFDKNKYSELFALLGSNLVPDFRGKFPKGVITNSSDILLVQKGNVQAHTHNVNLVLDEKEFPTVVSEPGRNDPNGEYSFDRDYKFDITKKYGDIIVRECHIGSDGNKEFLHDGSNGFPYQHHFHKTKFVEHSHAVKGYTQLSGGVDNVPNNMGVFYIVKAKEGKRCG